MKRPLPRVLGKSFDGGNRHTELAERTLSMERLPIGRTDYEFSIRFENNLLTNASKLCADRFLLFNSLWIFMTRGNFLVPGKQ